MDTVIPLGAFQTKYLAQDQMHNQTVIPFRCSVIPDLYAVILAEAGIQSVSAP